MNLITYNAAIQALAVCGNPDQAFEVYQEMRKNKFVPNEHTFTSLLAACCFDKVEGPRLAFQLLDEMKVFRVEPNIYIYNSVLKVMRDFKVSYQEQKASFPKDVKSSMTGENLHVSEHDLQHDDDETSDSERSKSKSPESYLQQGNMIEKQNDESLNLNDYFPGVEKFIQIMALEDVSPDIRTFQMLLYLTSSKSEEEYLMNLMKSCDITPDATLCNSLIKKKVLEGDLQQAKVQYLPVSAEQI